MRYVCDECDVGCSSAEDLARHQDLRGYHAALRDELRILAQARERLSLMGPDALMEKGIKRLARELDPGF